MYDDSCSEEHAARNGDENKEMVGGLRVVEDLAVWNYSTYNSYFISPWDVFLLPI